MRSRVKILSIILCLILLCIHGFSQTRRLSFQANGGVTLPNEKNIKPGFGTGFGFALGVTKKISISFDFGYWRSSVDEEAGKLLEGKLSINPFLISLQYALWQDKNVFPYVSLGAGYIFSHFELGEYFTIPEIKITQKVENGVGIYAGTGVMIQVKSNFAFFAEVSYLQRKATGITTISDLNFGVSSEEFSVNLNSLSLRLGLKYFM